MTQELKGWQDISSAPYETEVRVKVGEMTFLARLLPNASMDDEDQSCDQWVAERQGEHPPCWSDGACWTSNENEETSLQPTQWQPTEATRPSPHLELVEALKTADDAINEMFRYYDGGETRGSYDGKPERNQLRKAGYAVRQALSSYREEGCV